MRCGSPFPSVIYYREPICLILPKIMPRPDKCQHLFLGRLLRPPSLQTRPPPVVKNLYPFSRSKRSRADLARGQERQVAVGEAFLNSRKSFAVNLGVRIDEVVQRLALLLRRSEERRVGKECKI